MATIVIITESDYREIAQWEYEGGTICDVIYQVVPDVAEDTAELELALAAD